nr:hypothetical protein CKG001_17650 [Bdellovibrio sp. CKG001]
MANKNVIPPIYSTRTRVLTAKFEESQNISIQLPRDTVLVGLIVRLIGSVRTTFTGGTPFGRVEGAMESLIDRITVETNGQRTIKSVTPHMLHMQQFFTGANGSERFAQAGAAPIADNQPTTEGPFVFGTTGQYTTIRESVYLPFEQIHCEPGMGRENTYLNLKRASSAEIRFATKPLSHLNAASGVTGLVIDQANLLLEVTLIERQDIPASMAFQDWKQTFRRVPITGEVSEMALDIPQGNALSALLLYTQNGNNASSLVQKNAPSNSVISTLQLRKNGQESIQTLDFKTLQSRNRIDYGITANTAAGISRLDGVAHLNLLSRKDLTTAFINSKAFGVDNLQLLIASKAAGIVDYTNPAQLLLVQEEIVNY